VAEAARGLPSSSKPYYELPDVRLRGLVYLLRDDPRLQSFVERELGPLLEHDQRTRGDLADALRVFLDSGRNKSAAADAFRLSRPSFYQRLERIEQVLSVDLDDVDACLSLHVALIALESLRGTTPDGATRARRP
jgi:purine catabolism regulator